MDFFKLFSLNEIKWLRKKTKDLDTKKLDKTGGTLSGGITLPSSKYFGTNGEFGIDFNNSDMCGVNGIWLGDSAQSTGEGVLFPTESWTVETKTDVSKYDTLRIYQGVLYGPAPFHSGQTNITLTDTAVASKRVYFSSSYSGLGTAVVTAAPLHTNAGLISVSIWNVTATYFDLYVKKTSTGTGAVDIFWQSQPKT